MMVKHNKRVFHCDGSQTLQHFAQSCGVSDLGDTGIPNWDAVPALTDAAVRRRLDWTLLRGTSSLSPSGLL